MTKRTQPPRQEPDKHHDISVFITNLVSRDLATKLGAHYQLIRRGSQAVPALVRALGNDDGHLRLAAAQTLRGICEPAAAPALARALDDDEPSVRWVVAECLIAFDEVGVRPALQVLLDNHPPSRRLKEAVSHVVLGLSQGGLENIMRPVAQALHDNAPDEALIAEVHKAVTALEEE